MRICSFLPSTTEILYDLGLGDSVTGVTHECDYPPEAREKKRVIMSFIDPGKLSSREIDELVSRNAAEGKSTYLIDKDALKEADPDLILTQELCQVCAVSGNEVTEAVEALGKKPRIISLEPRALSEIIDTILIIGEATGTGEREGGAPPGKQKGPPGGLLYGRARPAVCGRTLGAGDGRDSRRLLRYREGRRAFLQGILEGDSGLRPPDAFHNAVRLRCRKNPGRDRNTD